MDGQGSCAVARWFGLALAGIILALALTPWPAAWPNADAAEDTPVYLYFFWSQRCPHCLEARPVVLELAASRPWLKLHDLEVLGNLENRRLFVDMAEALGDRAEAVPAFIFCDRMWTGSRWRPARPTWPANGWASWTTARSAPTRSCGGWRSA